MMNEANLNRLLSARQVPPVSSNLSSRIIAAAVVTAAHPQDVVNGLFAEIMAMFVIPRPAYALAFSLIVGLVVGLQLDSGDMAQNTLDWLSISNIEEGGWL